MSQLSRAELERMAELLADEQLDQLTPEDRGELEELRARAGDAGHPEDVVSGVVYAIEKRQRTSMPAALRAKVEASGRTIVRGDVAGKIGGGWHWWGVAAMIAVVLGGTAFMTIQSRTQQAEKAQREVAALNEKVKANEAFLIEARAQATQLTERLAASGQELVERDRKLAEAAAREVAIAEKLAVVTSDFEQARLKIAKLEAPIDPALVQQNRRLLLEVPGTVKLAWQPFDLPDAPSEQRNVSGDVVWNDEKEEGYLRFVGLAVNDPKKEQYQVWVIDERGMEQKVSGGVFNASNEGEVIVPIHPGIDVRKVKLFAITIEEPGGTWVPDLRRRVVVAPREG